MGMLDRGRIRWTHESKTKSTSGPEARFEPSEPIRTLLPRNKKAELVVRLCIRLKFARTLSGAAPLVNYSIRTTSWDWKATNGSHTLTGITPPRRTDNQPNSNPSFAWDPRFTKNEGQNTTFVFMIIYGFNLWIGIAYALHPPKSKSILKLSKRQRRVPDPPLRIHRLQEVHVAPRSLFQTLGKIQKHAPGMNEATW